MPLADLSPETRHLIDGRLQESVSGARFANVNPATEEVLGTAADATPADLHTAIAAARRAFDGTDWATNPALRAAACASCVPACWRRRSNCARSSCAKLARRWH